jgi:orotate phosphoribosyltransferase
MKLDNETAAKLAEFLLQIKSIKLETENYFEWTSGIKSPIYCDNRKTLSYPKIRTFIRQNLSKLIENKFGKPEVIGGIATGGIAQGALVAQDLGLPYIYVRSSAKEHGLGKMVEGEIQAGQSVILVEDLISTGKSSLNAVKAVRELGADVKGVVAIFSYGFKDTEKIFAKEKCPFYTLTSYDVVIEKAVEKGYINKDEVETLMEWRKAPKEWKKDI